jgi:hypothetical protein
MFNFNILTWANELATTDKEQAPGALCLAFSDGRKSYCCLGLGSTLVPDMKISKPMFYTLDRAVPQVKVGFGKLKADVLAPIEFMSWLGYDMSEKSADTDYDVYFDIPDSITERSSFDREAEGDGGNPDYDETCGLLRKNSAASLNDDGLTFAQIADIIRYFGLSDEVAPA